MQNTLELLAPNASPNAPFCTLTILPLSAPASAAWFLISNWAEPAPTALENILSNGVL